jgi:hypothetical protein
MLIPSPRIRLCSARYRLGSIIGLIHSRLVTVPPVVAASTSQRTHNEYWLPQTWKKIVGIRVAAKMSNKGRFELGPPIFSPLKFERVRSRIHPIPAPKNGIFLNWLRLANTVIDMRRIKVPKR